MIVTADSRVAGVARLANSVVAPQVRGDGGATTTRRRAADGGATAQPVISEGGRLAGLAGVADADQPVLGVPGVGALAVVSQVTVGIEGQRLAGEVGELVEIVEGPGLRQRRRIDRGGVAGLADRGDLVFPRAGEGEVGEVAGHEAGVGDAREAAVAQIVQVGPGGGKGAAGELARRDLAGLAEIAQGEGAEVAGVAGEAADWVVLEGLGTGALHGAPELHHHIGKAPNLPLYIGLLHRE